MPDYNPSLDLLRSLQVEITLVCDHCNFDDFFTDFDKEVVCNKFYTLGWRMIGVEVCCPKCAKQLIVEPQVQP